MLKWFKNLFRSKSPKYVSVAYGYKTILGIKDSDIEEGIIYHSEELRFVKFLCPCGCKEIESLSTSNSKEYDREKRMWGIELTNDNVTLHPSVGSQFQCESHYFIKDGKVVAAEYE